MALYLSPYVGKGQLRDPYRPKGIDTDGASCLDLRPDMTRCDGDGFGFAFLWQSQGIPAPVGAIKLADDYGDLLSMRQRRRLQSLLGLDFSADRTIQDAVETAMLNPRGHFSGIRPSRSHAEVWLGSTTGKRRWVYLPVLAGGSITDSFTRANETPVASPWTVLGGSTGQINLSANAITKVTTAGDLLLYYSNGGGWNANQSSQWDYVTQIGANSDWGPAVRIGSSGGFDAYIYVMYGGSQGAFKVIAGSFTTIQLGASGPVVGATVKLAATGTGPVTLDFSFNGTADANSPATDSTSVLSAAGNGAGVYWSELGGSIDNAVLTGEISGGGGAKKRMLAGLLAQRALRV